jgi:hypothetical protein
MGDDEFLEAWGFGFDIETQERFKRDFYSTRIKLDNAPENKEPVKDRLILI